MATQTAQIFQMSESSGDNGFATNLYPQIIDINTARTLLSCDWNKINTEEALQKIKIFLCLNENTPKDELINLVYNNKSMIGSTKKILIEILTGIKKELKPLEKLLTACLDNASHRVYENNLDYIIKLIESGCDANTINDIGQNIFHILASNGIIVNYYEKEIGYYDDKSYVRRLAQLGVYINLKDYNGKTPTDIIIEKKKITTLHAEILDLITHKKQEKQIDEVAYRKPDFWEWLLWGLTYWSKFIGMKIFNVVCFYIVARVLLGRPPHI